MEESKTEYLSELGPAPCGDASLNRRSATRGRAAVTPATSITLTTTSPSHSVHCERILKVCDWEFGSQAFCYPRHSFHRSGRWERPRFFPFTKMLVSRGDKVQTYIPKAYEFARTFAQIAGGTAMSMLPEILFDVPGTAPCIGGCVIAGSAERGVVDDHHRVFGYRNMYICDGSVLAANLRVNPSLTLRL